LIEPLIGVRWRLLCPKPQASSLEQKSCFLSALHAEGICPASTPWPANFIVAGQASTLRVEMQPVEGSITTS
jgi:hypothetical protein